MVLENSYFKERKQCDGRLIIIFIACNIKYLLLSTQRCKAVVKTSKQEQRNNYYGEIIKNYASYCSLG